MSNEKQETIAGNSAEMREALEKCRRVIHCAIIANILRADDAYDVMSEADNALAAKPRNCDIYDADSCRMAYHLYGSGVLSMQDFADWLFAPANGCEREEAR